MECATHTRGTVKMHADYIERSYGVPGIIYELSGDKWPPKMRVSGTRVTHKRPRTRPRSEDIDYVVKVRSTKQWKAIDKVWHCPTGDRTKHEIVGRSKNGDRTFLSSDRSFYAPGERHNSKRAVVCGDCGLLVFQLGKEACLVAGAETASNLCSVSASEVALVVLTQAHRRHNVKNDEADGLVARLVERITVLKPGGADGGY
ncbi:hypothetical protein BZM27_30515 [Paraburkholderia steynii]|uniref:Uncharacterized protein n=1 Tax=Paraburkholderia steynii TaxID=1245441 RepID=A0A4R0XA42_9BURK|nr:hypothetical protein BZM27_30515 [Paraburkholderia steynii]